MATLRFTKDHEWISVEGGIGTVGITNHAQGQLGDIVFVELPEVGRKAGQAEAVAVVESVKAASDVFAPISGGGGPYKHHIPATVDHLIQRSEFLTSYTPYQPEIAQGTLQYLFEFQTQVANLTAMEVANASRYDGSTATAEAALMAH